MDSLSIYFLKMLLRVIIENFLSFNDVVQFDMFPNRKRSVLDYHVYGDYKVPVLKMAAVYGANGAGKSNLVKALNFIKEFALNKEFLKQSPPEGHVFALQAAKNDRPLEIAVEFLVSKSVGYVYSVAVSAKGVERERLFRSGLGEKPMELIYERTLDTISFSFGTPSNIPELVGRLLKKNPWSSFLALNAEFPVVPGADIFRVVKWFRKNLVIIESNSMVPGLIHMMRSNRPLMEFTDSMMRRLCLGISSLEVETENADEWLMHHAGSFSQQEIEELKDNEFIARMDNERQSMSVFSEQGVKKVAKFVFNQFGTDGYVGKMDIANQSDGTVRLLSLLPALYDAIYRDTTVVIDEINHQMHPGLIVGLVQRFANDRISRGQLIFTTHETSFLEEYPVRSDVVDEKGEVESVITKEKLIRNDEIWFVEKKDGCSSLYSLNDFNFHNSLSRRNAYIDGRFRSYPQIEPHV